MLNYLGIAIIIFGAACGKGDKCERAYDKVAPMMKAMEKDGKAKAKDGVDDRSKMVDKCKADLKDHPEREKMLDCILGTSGELTMDKMMECSKEEKAERKKGEGGGGDVNAAHEALAKMTEFSDKMCSCSDAACAQKVSDDMTKWSQDMAKNQTSPPKLSDEDTKRATEIATKMGACMQKAMGAK